jgi:chaperone BCS1
MTHNLLELLNQNPFFSGGLSLMVLGAAAALLRKVPGQLWTLVQRWLSITVEVPDRDPAFRWLQVWLASQPYAGRARDLSLSTTWVPAGTDSDTALVFDADDSAATSLTSQVKFLLSPAPGTHLMLYKNRLLILRRSRRDLQNGNARTFQENLTLQIIGGTRMLIEQLLADARKLACPRTPGVSILTARYENWETTSWQPRRPVESLVLAGDLLDELLNDLRTFYASRAWYIQRGIPHRRGYLLHGPPGNGKTTLVLAAAGELNLSVAVLSLSNRLLSDDALRCLVDALPPATLLLIEDVDCVFKSERTTTDQTGVTLSGLLNALDGVSSREGRVMFLTTNHPERLDPALVRPGRVDRKVELGHASADQARRMYLWFYQGYGLSGMALGSLADRFAAQVPPGRVCMAAIQEHLLRHRSSPEAAANEVVFDEYVPNQGVSGTYKPALLAEAR